MMAPHGLEGRDEFVERGARVEVETFRCAKRESGGVCSAGSAPRPASRTMKRLQREMRRGFVPDRPRKDVERGVTLSSW